MHVAKMAGLKAVTRWAVILTLCAISALLSYSIFIQLSFGSSCGDGLSVTREDAAERNALSETVVPISGPTVDLKAHALSK